jgi:transcription elongation factor Elf1
MGRRRRKKIVIVRRTLPKVFRCPGCGKESIRVYLYKNAMSAEVRCAQCGLYDRMAYRFPLKEIDIYCKFIDKYYEGKIA